MFSLSAWTESKECSSPSSGSALVGMLVAEVQELAQLEGDGAIALERSEANTTAMYIISLGKCI